VCDLINFVSAYFCVKTVSIPSAFQNVDDIQKKKCDICFMYGHGIWSCTLRGDFVLQESEQGAPVCDCT
jgi:hypothetical protein